MRRSLRFALCAFLLACAPATQHAYIAPSVDTIVSTTEVHEANPPAHLIYIENHSTVPVEVFSIRLTDCQNVREQCGPRNTHLRVPAGNRVIAVRVEPESKERGFYYRFGFSWHEDSSYTQALTALATAGDEKARVQLSAMQHADSLRRSETGAHYNDLSRSDFAALASKVASMRAYPESLVLAPGERTTIERIRLLLLDNQGVVLGQTRWMAWRVEERGPIEFLPPNQINAKRAGRSVIRFTLAEEAQKALASPVNDVEFPIIVAYPQEAHAPTFLGRTVDADSKKPLACASVALEDSAQNVVARTRTGGGGTFILLAPRPGTYRVRVETPGWAPAYGPSELAGPDAEKQEEFLVRFTEQMLRPRFIRDADEMEHARPAAVTMAPLGTPEAKSSKQTIPIVSGVTLGGSEAMPILGIVGRAPVGTSWMQFAVDSTGHVDTGSITLPNGADPKNLASVASVLPRVRFTPARENGKPVCELLRMQVNFSAR